MKRILIIGGSRGIGKRILETQSKLHHCINISRNEPEGITSSFEHHSLDVTIDDIPKFEQLDALIYCPGTIKLKPISSLKESDFLYDFNVNILGAIRCIKTNLRALKKSENGTIILFSSVAANKGMPFHSSIAIAKAGIEGL